MHSMMREIGVSLNLAKNGTPTRTGTDGERVGGLRLRAVLRYQVALTGMRKSHSARIARYAMLTSGSFPGLWGVEAENDDARLSLMNPTAYEFAPLMPQSHTG